MSYDEYLQKKQAANRRALLLEDLTALLDDAETRQILRAQDERSRSETKTLYSLLRHFEEERGVALHVDNRRLGAWMLDLALDHRVHVRVEHWP